MFKKLLIVFSLFGVSACGNPANEIDGMIEDGDITEAVEWMDEELAATPQDELFNGLAAEVKTILCIQTKCTETNPKLLQQIKGHLKYVKGPIDTGDEKPRDIYKNIFEIAKGFKNDTNNPKPIIDFINIIPPHISNKNFPDLLMDMAIESIDNVEIPATLSLLKEINKIAPSSKYAVYTPLLVAIISNNKIAINPALAQSRQANAKLTTKIAHILPYAFLLQHIEVNSNNGSFDFIKNFPQDINNLKLSKANYKLAKQWLAVTLNEMSKNKKVIDLASKYIDEMKTVNTKNNNKKVVNKNPSTIKAIGTPKTTEEVALSTKDKKELFKLYLLKTSLAFDPNQLSVWNEFLQPAMEYVDKTGYVDLLFSGIDQTKMPKDAIKPYNKKLFTLIGNKFANNENAVSLLQKIIIPRTNNADVITRLDEYFNLGISKAIKENNYKDLVDYASYKPEIAKPYRQKIASIIAQALEDLWKKNEFTEMSKLALFLKNSMDIDFNLDNLIIKKFHEYVAKNKFDEQLSSNVINPLLKKQIEIRIDFGEKFKFLQKYFANSPKVLDSQLKTLVLNAKGIYGTPVAFYKLYHLFNEKSFSLKDRNEFLVGAIKDSLEKNEKLSASEMISTGYKLYKNHPDITLPFILSQTLDRIKTLDDAKAVWNTSNNEIKNNLKSIKPQFTTLMKAIDLFDNNNKKQSFEMFSVLSDKKYLEIADSYLLKFRKIVGDHKGVFVTDNTNEKMHASIIVINPLSNPKDVTSLLNVKVKIINALGSVIIKSNKELIENYGKTFSYTFKGKVNPDIQILPITEEQRAGATLPQSFERTFGEIIGIKFDKNEKGEDTVSAVITDGTTFPLHRVSSYTKKPLFPQGKFGIVEQLSLHNKNTDHVMPVGTIIKIKTNEKRPIQPIYEGKKLAIVYPVTGEVMHPSSPIPRKFKGFYSADTNIVDFEYEYPLSKGKKGELKAITKCQFLDNTIICASHNKHWSRLKYSHIVKGYKASESEFEMAPMGDNNKILMPPAIQ